MILENKNTLLPRGVLLLIVIIIFAPFYKRGLSSHAQLVVASLNTQTHPVYYDSWQSNIIFLRPITRWCSALIPTIFFGKHSHPGTVREMTATIMPVALGVSFNTAQQTWSEQEWEDYSDTILHISHPTNGASVRENSYIRIYRTSRITCL